MSQELDSLRRKIVFELIENGKCIDRILRKSGYKKAKSKNIVSEYIIPYRFYHPFFENLFFVEDSLFVLQSPWHKYVHSFSHDIKVECKIIDSLIINDTLIQFDYNIYIKNINNFAKSEDKLFLKKISNSLFMVYAGTNVIEFGLGSAVVIFVLFDKDGKYKIKYRKIQFG